MRDFCMQRISSPSLLPHSPPPLHVHYSTVHYTTPHHTTLHYTTLHYTTHTHTLWHTHNWHIPSQSPFRFCLYPLLQSHLYDPGRLVQRLFEPHTVALLHSSISGKVCTTRVSLTNELVNHAYLYNVFWLMCNHSDSHTCTSLVD